MLLTKLFLDITVDDRFEGSILCGQIAAGVFAKRCRLPKSMTEDL